MNVLIVYHSDYGHTEQVARAVAAGVTAAGAGAARVRLQQAADCGLEDLISADVIVFGTPVHMGGMAWQMKRLIDRAGKLWLGGELEGKVAGVFVTGGGFGGQGGGAEHTLIGLHANALEHGMLVVGFPRSLPGYAEAGLHWGLCVRTGDHQGMPQEVREEQLMAARSYGAHVCELAARLLG